VTGGKAIPQCGSVEAQRGLDFSQRQPENWRGLSGQVRDVFGSLEPNLRTVILRLVSRLTPKPLKPAIKQFRRGLWIYLLAAALVSTGVEMTGAAADDPFVIRGYYTTFMRMPTFGLPEWKQMIDCMQEDAANLLVLWTAGAFRSRQFPITWKYNADHKNVQEDYVRELIDYAHTKGIRVVLGFTPFAYDGTNQFPLEHPELKATQRNGEPASLWGM